MPNSQEIQKKTSRAWTPERRAQHSAFIRKLAPWTKSTGPRTVAGKAKSSMNALKHGQYCRQAYEFRYALRRRISYIQYICHRYEESFLFQRNELLSAKHQKCHHVPPQGTRHMDNSHYDAVFSGHQRKKD